MRQATWGLARVRLIITLTGPKVILQTNTAHPLAFGTNGTLHMRIDSSGNVGIGSSTANHFSTTSTANVLGVKSTAGALVSIAATGTNFSGIDLGTDSIRRAGMYSLNGSSLGFYTNPTNSRQATWALGWFQRLGMV